MQLGICVSFGCTCDTTDMQSSSCVKCTTLSCACSDGDSIEMLLRTCCFHEHKHNAFRESLAHHLQLLKGILMSPFVTSDTDIESSPNISHQWQRVIGLHSVHMWVLSRFPARLTSLHVLPFLCAVLGSIKLCGLTNPLELPLQQACRGAFC